MIALVITIVVLLILVEISISLTVGRNGVLAQASSSVIVNRSSKAREEVLMAWTSVKTKYWTEWAQNSSKNLEDYLNKDLLNTYLVGTGRITEELSYDNEKEAYLVKYKANDQGQDYEFYVTLDGVVTGDAVLATSGGSNPVAQTYTVTYLANTGTGSMDEGTKNHGVDYTIASNEFTPPNGKVFKNWNTQADGNGTSYSAGATYSIDENLTLYAQWKKEGRVDSIANRGKIVKYNNSTNWEVFFEDNGRIYLIYKDKNAPYTSLNAPILGTKNWSAIYNNPGNYYATGTSSTPAHLTGYLLDSNYTERFKPATQAGWLNKYMTWLGDGTTNYSDAGNMAFTLFMLDQNVWKYGTLTPDSNSNATAYYDVNYADWVIGGPTMEMMVATANKLYPSQTNSCRVEVANGYNKTGLGSNTLPAGTVLNHTSESNYHYYWLASPYYSYDNFAWYFNGNYAAVSYDYYNYGIGFRPVVCLKSGVTLTTEGATETDYVLKTN